LYDGVGDTFGLIKALDSIQTRHSCNAFGSARAGLAQQIKSPPPDTKV
jgi:hypothetical protein